MCDKQTTADNKMPSSCCIKPKDGSDLKNQFPKFRIENNILIGEELPVKRDPVNVSEILLNILKSNPECIGQIDAFTGKKYTYADMVERSIKCALWLKKQGVKPGDIVGLCTDNNLDAIVIMLGTMYIGAISNTWDHELSPNTAKYFLSLTSPTIIFTISLSAESLTEAAKQLNMDIKVVTIDKLNGYESFEDVLNTHDTCQIAEFKCTPINNPDEVALIVLSSGTTGMPKATKISHTSLHNAMFSQSSKDMKNNICVWTPTLRWHYGVMLAFNALTACATRVVTPDCVLDDFTIQQCQFIEKYRVTWFATDPCMMIQLAKTDILEKYPLTSLKKILCSGAHLRKHYQEILAKKLPHVLLVCSYGSTDFGGTSCCQTEHSKPGSVGFITSCTQLKVVDVDTGKVLGANQIGEIHFNGPCKMIGYHKNPEATKRAFDSDGWLHTGDLGYYDDDGEVFLVDRISEFILFRSINVSPAEIEAVLTTHPAVARAAVIGVHHEIDEQHPMAVVSLMPDKTVTEQELINLVEKNLPDHCRLRAGVKILDQLPRTGTGKIAKKQIREMFAH
ncbi:luciferin 4-monooxygenase-like [Ooceraea biroi]|uniref:luciferin 4-monooxygenase-like n=1 Tax=Ooceraea biroi TaxID=2015173 RepID=UPI0005BAB2C3|nr:luciferin 4-monooxygenase-like [Ooceraea biroi]